ncbi:hypothetical protein Rhow_008967 [Rhodococcus wratislaviensis]|uniref:Uncharacterized protein n=1 Tax=Rhodococcus wratislaviensis TaxID=44752 RepID=A0A402CLE7_RHOWR|nr:hypothetical protein Rhow_008967 [Rhodococcus wratislaviensis]
MTDNGDVPRELSGLVVPLLGSLEATVKSQGVVYDVVA